MSEKRKEEGEMDEEKAINYVLFAYDAITDKTMNDYPLAYLDELQIEEVCTEMLRELNEWRERWQ